MISYPSQRKRARGYVEELVDCEAAEEELALAATLVDQTTRRELDFARYKDEYAEKLTQIIDAAVHGKELVAAPADEPRQVLSLLDALKASVAQEVSPVENGAARDTLGKQLSRPRGRRKAAAKKPASRRPRKKSA